MKLISSHWNSNGLSHSSVQVGLFSTTKIPLWKKLTPTHPRAGAMQCFHVITITDYFKIFELNPEKIIDYIFNRLKNVMDYFL